MMQNTASFLCPADGVWIIGAAPPLEICSIFYVFGPVLAKMEVFVQKLWKEDEERH